MQGVLSRASFRRSPVSGQKYFTVLSLHISNIYAKKKGIAKKLILTLRAIMISQEVDLVAGDFNGAAWRCRAKTTSVLLTKHLRIVPCLRHRAPHLCGVLDPFRTIGQTSADFSNHRVLTAFGKCISMVHSPFQGKRLVYAPPIKVAITKHGFIWMDFVDWNKRWSKHDVYEQHIFFKERPADYSNGIGEVMSDHSLSS